MTPPTEPTPEERETIGLEILYVMDAPPIPDGCRITASIERDPSKLPEMRWVKRKGSYILETYVPEAAGMDESGGIHYTGRGWWQEVPFWPGE